MRKIPVKERNQSTIINEQWDNRVRQLLPRDSENLPKEEQTKKTNQNTKKLYWDEEKINWSIWKERTNIREQVRWR